MSDHEPREPVQLRYPGGKDGMWQAGCSCGYVTSPHDTPEAARKPLTQHLEAVRR